MARIYAILKSSLDSSHSRRHLLGDASDHLAAVAVRQPSTGTGGGKGRAGAAILDPVFGDRCIGDRRMCTNRRRTVGLCPDGWTRGRRAARHEESRERPLRLRRPCPCRGVAGTHACFLYRLAEQFLDIRAQRVGLLAHDVSVGPLAAPERSEA